MESNTAMGVEKEYIELFQKAESIILKNSSDVINAKRAKALDDFKTIGLPTKRVEKYKYTDISKSFERDYGLNLNRLNIPISELAKFQCDVHNMNTMNFFVVNDSFYSKDNSLANLPKGVILGSLRDLSITNPELVSKYYGELADTSKDGITAFNTSFVQDGVFLYVPKNVVIEKPIQLVNLLRSNVDLMVNRRMIVVVEDCAEVKLLVCDHAIDDVNFLTTQVVEVYVGRNAKFDMYELEETHEKNTKISNTYVNQKSDSNVLLNGITLHNGLTRNCVEVCLDGEGSHVDMYGAVIADKKQHVDNNTTIEHKVPNCTSNELYKYVLNDEAVGAFAGLVLVDKDAQNTNSQQTNRNLCASRESKMFTQPQLEIYADDVKCSHGATIGQLDEKALFYMRARGIAEKEAKLLLMFAFVNEVIDSIKIDALRDRLHLLVERRFRGELSRCKECSLHS